MNILKMPIVVIVVILLFSSMALGATVTINHAGGQLTGTLGQGGLKVDQSGNVIVYVVENLTGGLCENHAPTINVPNPPTSATLNKTISVSFNTNDPDGQMVNVTANQGTISGSNNTWNWTWTPSITGNYTITLTANDNQSCNNTSSYSWNIAVSDGTSGTTDPPNTITLSYNKETGNLSLPKKGTLYFKARLDSPCTTTLGQLRIKVISYSLNSNPDLVVKKSNNGTEQWPTYSDYDNLREQYGYNAGQKTDGTFFTNFTLDYGGETVIVRRQYDSISNFNQADTYYIMLYNNSDKDATIHMIYWCY